MDTPLTIGSTVRARGERFSVVDVESLPGHPSYPLLRLTLRALEGEMRGQEISVLHPIEEIEPEEISDLALEKSGRLARFRLLHDVFRLELSPPYDVLISARRSRINLEPYQYVPALRALDLPRPRLLLTDDVGLGKTVEAGLILKDLTARRRANRVLIVTPAGIMDQWQKELKGKFGFKFTVFDKDTIHEIRKRIEFGANPWMAEHRIIASMDFIKRREGAFRELSSTKWDVVIVDEAHHFSTGRSEDDITDRYRLGRWLSEATDALLLLTATPHDGYDESFASLLGLLEPSLVVPGEGLRFEHYQRYVVRRLKRHIKKEDGTPKFLQRQVIPVPVHLTSSEAALHAAVLSQARELEDFASRVRLRLDAEAIRLVATILRKRAASSQHALAETLERRRLNLTERIEDLELQRDHVRALRRGEAIPDEALSRLEHDAHKSYLAVMRRLGSRVRRTEDEVTSIESLQTLLRQCRQEPESKMAILLNQLRAVHADHPGDKVIIFTEYYDTALSIANSLQSEQEYAGKFCLLSGKYCFINFDQPVVTKRDQVLAEFEGPNKFILIATDAGGEGLNLHKNCHRIIHFELPWNPNRLEQRNGRIDRYGQLKTPIVSFLYASDTYEGEVLARLVEKIERQMHRLGSIGDVLGQIQVEHIEQILSRPPDDLNAAIRQADQEIEAELARLATASLHGILGAGHLNQEEVNQAKKAADQGNSESVDLADFLCRAVVGAGGRVERSDRIRVWTPPSWQSGSIPPFYQDLLPLTPETSLEGDEENLLDEDHALLKEAIRWVKASRFNPGDDHRLAYVCTPDISEPDLVATFLIQLRDGEGRETERLEAVLVTPDVRVSSERDADLEALRTEGPGNVPPDVLERLFGTWWQSAREAALTEARRRAAGWRQAIIALRMLSQDQFQQELEIWNSAVRKVILRDHTSSRQLELFGSPDLPPAIKRRLRQHEERYHQRRAFLDQRIKFDAPAVEPLGVLLRVPASALNP